MFHLLFLLKKTREMSRNQNNRRNETRMTTLLYIISHSSLCHMSVPKIYSLITNIYMVVLSGVRTIMIMSLVISEAFLSGFTINTTTLSCRTHFIRSFLVVFLYWFYVCWIMKTSRSIYYWSTIYIYIGVGVFKSGVLDIRTFRIVDFTIRMRIRIFGYPKFGSFG